MTEATSNNLNMKIAVLGLGCGGVRTLNALAALPAADKLFLYALDTDGQTLGQSKLPETHRLMLDEGGSWGYSCLTMIDRETVGILYESSTAHILFQAVKLEDILNLNK